MEIALIIVAICLVGFMSWVFISAFAKKDKKPPNKKTEPEKKDETKKDVDKKEEKSAPKNDIPDVLKEVTQGNYMYDIAHEQPDDITEDLMVENANITKDKTESVEESYEKIESIELDVDDDEDECLDVRSILADMDGEDGEKTDDLENASKQDIDLSKLSKTEKIIMLSNMLKKKD